MKPHYLLQTAQAALLAALPSITNAALCNGEVIYPFPPNGPSAGYDTHLQFGSHIYTRALVNRNYCDWYATKNAVTDDYSIYPTSRPGDARRAEIHGYDRYGRPIDVESEGRATQSAFCGTSSVLRRNYGYTNSTVNLGDIITFKKLGAATDEITEIPVALCFAFSSMWNQSTSIYPNSSAASVTTSVSAFYDPENDNIGGDYYGFDGSYNNYGIIGQVEDGAWVDKKCESGTMVMTGDGAGYTLNLYLANNGQTGREGGNIVTKQGKASAQLYIKSLPEGVSCESSSGMFPGCERPFEQDGVTTACAEPAPQKQPDAPSCEEGDNTFVANPVNFALGFKAQKETDYTAGDLSFTRSYRSDADWVSHNAGQNWRHNYDRALKFTTGRAETVEITTSKGTVELFRKGFDGTWVATDPDIKSGFEETADGYVYTYAGQGDNKEYFDGNGNLRRIVPQAGRSIDLSYNASGQLETIRDEQGQSITLGYDGQNRIASLITPDGMYTYGYDGQNNLTSVYKPDGTSRTYHYEDARFANALTGITDENNVRFATWTYDDEGRAITSQHANGADNYTITYNPDETVSVTNPLGKQTTYTFETINGVRKIVGVEGHQSTNCAAGDRETTYTPEGWVDTRMDWEGNLTDYDYDETGLVTAITEDAGGPDERTKTITYDPALHLKDIITEQGRTTDYDYDPYGRVTSVAITDTNTGETRATTYSYYPNSMNGNGDLVLGRVHTVDGPRSDVNDVTTYGYDANNRLVSTINALGHETRITSFDAADRPLTTLDANGVATGMTYYASGRLETSTVAPGTALEAITTYTYDDAGNIETLTLPNGVALTYSYDDAGRLTGVEDALGNTITYILDPAGNRTGEEMRDSGGMLTYTNTKVFDELSRLIEVVDANTDPTTFAYDKNGNLKQTVDANTNPTTYAYDGLNRLISTTDALSGQTVTSINALDQTESVTDPRTNATQYSYNAFGDLTQLISPDTGTTTYTYDPAGNRITQTDARGFVTEYDYDAINRVTDVTYPDEPTQNAHFTYDAPGCGASIGRLCSVTDAAGSSSYIYDDLGRVSSATKVRGSHSFTTGYTYDAAGNLETLTLPSGREVTYGRNAAGQVDSVTAQVGGIAQTVADNITYLPFGPIEGLDYSNGLMLDVSYDQDHELLNRTVSGGISDVPYAHDPAGNMTLKGDTTYDYDPLNRLDIEFNSLTGDTIDYDHDAIGNRIAEIFNGSTSTYAYSLTSSWLNSIDSEMLTYDQAGNMETDRSGAREFSWTPGGRMAQVEDGGVSVGQYTYDANGQRSQKITSSGTTYFIYGAGHQLLGEYDASGDTIREYVYLSGEPLAQVNADESLLYLHTDHLATPRVATDESANPVWSWESDAFGRGAPSGTETVNLRFPGQYYDTETALHYNWNRYYDPETGRYISSDPIGLDGGLNTYVYAEGNPTRFTDPEGLLVKATLYRRFNTLVVRDVDTGDEVFLQAFTGGIVRDGKIISPGDSSNQNLHQVAIILLLIVLLQELIGMGY
ncbi:MAG: DUF6531 domain-containing protein [Candidatus Thiodiazotropha endolucinida]|nr:DUF6531 domain-containing protein [Candidatus Thiodiazotropha endolucinida]